MLMLKTMDPCCHGDVELEPGYTGAQSGYVSSENNGTPHVATAKRVARTPMTLVPIPAFTCDKR